MRNSRSRLVSAIGFLILGLVAIFLIGTSLVFPGQKVPQAGDSETAVKESTERLMSPRSATPSRLAVFHAPPAIASVIVQPPTIVQGNKVTVVVNLREPATREGRVQLSRRTGTSSQLWKEKRFSKGVRTITFKDLRVACRYPFDRGFTVAVSARLVYQEGSSTVRTVVKYGNTLNVLKYSPRVRGASGTGRSRSVPRGSEQQFAVGINQLACESTRVRLTFELQTFGFGISNMVVTPNPIVIQRGQWRAFFKVKIPQSRPPAKFRYLGRVAGSGHKWAYYHWIHVD